MVNLSAKIQVLEKLNKADHKDIQTQTDDLMTNQFQHCIIRLDRNSLRYQTTNCNTSSNPLPNERGSVNSKWTPVPMLDSRRFKKAIVSYGMHLPFVKQILNSWSVCNRIIPKHWIDLVKGVLEPGPQLQ